MKKKILNLLLAVFLVCRIKAQETIKFNKNPYTNENHFIIKLEKNGKTNRKKFFDVKDNVFKYGYEKPVVTVDDFRSITIQKKGKTFDLILNLDADGVIDLDVSTTKYIQREHAFVFNDTIYQTKQFSSPSYDGEFLIENVSEEQKNKIVNFYKKLPNHELQRKLYNAIRNHKITKVDSLLNIGATLSEINTSLGYNKFGGVFYDVFSRRNGEYPKYKIMADYLLQQGFVPKVKTYKEAIVYDDIAFVKKYFKNIKDQKEKIKLLRRELKSLLANGSLEMMEVYEDLGFDFETEKYGGDDMLKYTVINGSANKIPFMLEKKIPYDKRALLIYALVYNSIDVTDKLLEGGLDLNVLFKTNNSIAQELILSEYSAGYYLGDVSLKKIPLMIERGFNPKTVGNEGKTLLHTLANKSHFFLDYVSGVPSNYKISKTTQQVIDVVSLIKSKEVNLVHVKDINGYTAYDYVLSKIKEMNTSAEEEEDKIDVNTKLVQAYLAVFKN